MVRWRLLGEAEWKFCDSFRQQHGICGQLRSYPTESGVALGGMVMSFTIRQLCAMGTVDVSVILGLVLYKPHW